MEKVADACLRNGDITQAAQIYSTLENINPRCSHMSRLCRVLCDPTSVPLPYRYSDICDALLDFHFTAEILVGNDLSLESIQKKYQRLVILVHPDKNPNPNSKEAFLRLAVMREEAKDCLAQKLAIKGQQEKRSERDHQKLKRKGGGGGADGHGGGAGGSLPNLADLKSNKIRLKSLKRKSIEDNFEIFSVRRGNRLQKRYNPFDIDDTDEEKENSNSSSIRNSQHLSSINSSSSSASFAHRTYPGRKKPGKQDIDSYPFSENRINAGATCQTRMFSASRKSVNLAQVLEEGRHYLRQEEEEVRKREEKKREVEIEETGDIMDLLRIRNELSQLIDTMGEKRKQRIELHTDLSYDSYVREQKMGPKPQAFVIVPLERK